MNSWLSIDAKLMILTVNHAPIPKKMFVQEPTLPFESDYSELPLIRPLLGTTVRVSGLEGWGGLISGVQISFSRQLNIAGVGTVEPVYNGHCVSRSPLDL